MITFRGVIQEKGDKEAFFNILDVDNREATEEELELFDEDILSISDNATDINGNYLLDFGRS
jgi:hypothetical protein